MPSVKIKRKKEAKGGGTEIRKRKKTTYHAATEVIRKTKMLQFCAVHRFQWLCQHFDRSSIDPHTQKKQFQRQVFTKNFLFLA